MNKEWSSLNKEMQACLKKKETYQAGLGTLFELRARLMQTLLSFREQLRREDFNAMPYMNADGYHSKTIAYSIWHIFRIEDIVAHTLIRGDEQLDLDELYSYILEVRRSTEDLLQGLSFEELKRPIPPERKEQLESLNVVSRDEEAFWLVDYWCNKDVRGLIQMPFSRHWIMHTEACLRIQNKLYHETTQA